MDFQWKTYDIEWLKDTLGVIGVLLLVAFVGFLFVTPIVKVSEQRGSLETYYVQASQAATPTEFAAALRQLDKALDKAGMVSGNTWLFSNAPHDDMALKREQFSSLAQRAETFAALPVSTTEVSTGLADLRVALKAIDLGVYGFWQWQQGGAWFQWYLPGIFLVLAIALFIVSDALPYRIRRRVRVAVTPA